MKNSIKAFLSLSYISLCACVNETAIENYYEGEVIITAYQDLSTRTTLVNNTNVYWKPSDEIKVFSAGVSSKFISQNTEDSASADFVGQLSSTFGGNEGNAQDYFIYALYPYRDDSTFADGIITTFLPNEQEAVDGTFADDLFISVGRSNSLTVPFLNVCSGIRFTVEGEGIMAVELTGNNGESLAGSFSCCFDNDGTLIISKQSLHKDKIRLNAPRGRSFIPGEQYFIVMLPNTFESGFTLTFFKDGFKADKIINKPITLQRSSIGNLMNADKQCRFVRYKDQEQLQRERDALIAIYNALDGDNWEHKDNWCSDKPVSEWEGIEVSYYSGFVRSLKLEGENVSGVIPKELADLSSLYYLSIERTNVKSFDVDSIMPNIEIINSYDNICLSLSDFVPLLSLTPNLMMFYLLREHYNPEQKESPYLFPIQLLKLTSLCVLDLECCNLTGGIPDEFYNLTNLEVLKLYDSPIGGEISPKISNLINLKRLELRACELEGLLPESLSVLLDNNLDNCQLSFNHLSGPIPPSVSSHNKWKNIWGDIITGNNFELQEPDIPIPDFCIHDYKGDVIKSDDIYDRFNYLLVYQYDSDVFPYFSFAAPPLYYIKTVYDLFYNKGLYVLSIMAESNDEKEISDLVQTYNLQWPFCRLYEENQINGNHYYPTNNYPYVSIIDCINRKLVYASSFHDYCELEPFILKLFDNEIYESKDYSLDGTVAQIQEAVEGNGINIVIMGDGFTDQDVLNGTYDSTIIQAMNNLFNEEPFKSMRPLFNCYNVRVISPRNVGFDFGANTALQCGFYSESVVYGNDQKVIEYAKQAIPEDKLDDTVIVVLMNKDAYAGTCYMYDGPAGDYGRGLSIAYFPICGDTDTFNGLVSHEAGGHGFAKLADEYAYENNGAIPQEEIYAARAKEPYGWWKNVDFTNDLTQIKWSQFINDSRYAGENIGCYEGGYTYWSGVWRPTEDSIMRYNTGGFNAPSRYAIWYRINKLAYGNNWSGTYEDFVAFDAMNRTPAASARRAAQRRNCVEKNRPPLAPPVIVGRSWREAKKEIQELL